MNDRKLLEAAAKAAGIEIRCFVDWVTDYDSPHYSISAIQRAGTWETWNPLVDDGDAFRLAVQFNLFDENPDFQYTMYEEMNNQSDNLYSTRRAIVRAVVSIGSRR